MTDLFYKYGVNRMNLRYGDEEFYTDNLEPAAEDWYLGIRKALLEAMDNGIVFFTESSKPKVLQHIKEVGGIEKMKEELRTIITKKYISVDVLRRGDQLTYFKSYVSPHRPLAPICFIFRGVVYGGEMVYFKCRITQFNKLGIDVHWAQYEYDQYTI